VLGAGRRVVRSSRGRGLSRYLKKKRVFYIGNLGMNLFARRGDKVSIRKGEKKNLNHTTGGVLGGLP